MMSYLIIQFDTPLALYDNPDTIFHSMCEKKVSVNLWDLLASLLICTGSGPAGYPQHSGRSSCGLQACCTMI